MKFRMKALGGFVAALATCAVQNPLPAAAGGARYVVTNDDNGSGQNSATLYKMTGNLPAH
jgi:hypothetical protein